jgi:hypothetical protein
MLQYYRYPKKPLMFVHVVGDIRKYLFSQSSVSSLQYDVINIKSQSS